MFVCWNEMEYVSKFARVKRRRDEVKSIWDLCLFVGRFDRVLTILNGEHEKEESGLLEKKGVLC